MTNTDITVDERWLAETERLAGEATAGPWKYELTDEGTVGVVFDSGHSVAWDLEGTCAQCFGTMEHIARVDPAAVTAWARETRRAWAREAELAGLLARAREYVSEEVTRYSHFDPSIYLFCRYLLAQIDAALRADTPAREVVRVGTFITCAGCGEIVDVPDELAGAMTAETHSLHTGEPYYCDACEGA